MTEHDAITLFETSDGGRSMKPGRHESRLYVEDGGGMGTMEADVVELEEPVSEFEMGSWDLEDYPEEVQEFLRGDTDE